MHENAHGQSLVVAHRRWRLHLRPLDPEHGDIRVVELGFSFEVEEVPQPTPLMKCSAKAVTNLPFPEAMTAGLVVYGPTTHLELDELR